MRIQKVELEFVVVRSYGVYCYLATNQINNQTTVCVLKCSSCYGINTSNEPYEKLQNAFSCRLGRFCANCGCNSNEVIDSVSF